MLATELLLWTLLLFVIILLRYLLFSGVYHYWFRLRLRDHLGRRIFHYEPEHGALVWREIYRSAGVSLIFALAGAVTIWCWHQGHTQQAR